MGIGGYRPPLSRSASLPFVGAVWHIDLYTHAHAPGRSLSPLTTTGLRVISRGRAGNLQRGQKLEAAMAMRMHSLQN